MENDFDDELSKIEESVNAETKQIIQHHDISINSKISNNISNKIDAHLIAHVYGKANGRYSPVCVGCNKCTCMNHGVACNVYENSIIKMCEKCNVECEKSTISTKSIGCINVCFMCDVCKKEFKYDVIDKKTKKIKFTLCTDVYEKNCNFMNCNSLNDRYDLDVFINNKPKEEQESFYTTDLNGKRKIEIEKYKEELFLQLSKKNKNVLRDTIKGKTWKDILFE